MKTASAALMVLAFLEVCVALVVVGFATLGHASVPQWAACSIVVGVPFLCGVMCAALATDD